MWVLNILRRIKVNLLHTTSYVKNVFMFTEQQILQIRTAISSLWGADYLYPKIM